MSKKTGPSAGKRKRTWIILLIALLASALVGGSILLTDHYKTIEYENYIWENYSVTVTLNYYDGTRKMVTTLINEPVELDIPPEIEGHTFLGWENSRGELLRPSMIIAGATEEYTARYIISLDTMRHMPYLFADEYGFFHADDELTSGDAVRMIWSVLAEHPEPDTWYPNISEDSVYALPAAVLKTMGILDGSRFYPEESITRGELIRMLAAFFPPAEKDCSFSDIREDSDNYGAFCTAVERGWIDGEGRMRPEQLITRIDAVRLMNKVLGRDDSPDAAEEQIGGMLEYMPGDAYYLPLAEAVVSHTCSFSGEHEKWDASEPLEILPEGFALIGARMYRINEGGHIVRNIEEDGFRFGSDGIYTSGDPELDALVYEVIDSLYSEGMTREELLHELFEYTISSFTYLRRTYYKYGDTTYAPEAAYVMLSTGKGNCYCYAGTFCMFARSLGYNAVVYSGSVGKDREPHGWCEIIIDEVPYICDAELMMRRRTSGGPELDMYMKRYEELRGWTYVRYV
jgi:hypothetical protein